MIGAILATALAGSSITGPYGLWARASWGATRPNVRLLLENRSKVEAWLVDVNCSAYDAKGKLVAVATANVAKLEPGERAETWATAESGASATRFTCQITVSDWRKPNSDQAAVHP